MPLIAKDPGGASFIPPAPEGTDVATCIKVIDLGTQTSEFQGKQITRRQVQISWELTNTLIEEGDFAGKPHVISKWYTLSLGEKANLRKDLESWRGKKFTAEELEGFDILKLLGVPCLINIIHEEKKDNRIVAKISAVLKLPKGTEAPKPIQTPISFLIDEWDHELFQSLPEYLRNIIELSEEAKEKRKPPSNGGDSVNDDIPF